MKRTTFALALAAVATLAAASAGFASMHNADGSERAWVLPAAAVDSPAPKSGGLQTAVLSGGCFWGIQAVFQHVKGVRSVVSGYAGGAAATAQYELVGTGTTGHAESVQITFDPKQVSFGRILRIFFSVATDPTQVNEQFPDSGTQYRSEVFYADADQKRVAEAYIHQLDQAKAFSRPIATRVDPLHGFYKAEDYHQDYLLRHPDNPYIATYDQPKVASLQRLFPTDYRAAPARVFKAG